MKLKVKTLTGVVHEVEAQPSESIVSLKKSLAQRTQIPMENQKLLHGTKLLSDEMSLQETGLLEGDIMVVLSKRAPRPIPIPKDNSPIPTKSMILEHTSYGKKPPKQSKPAATPSTAISQLRTQLQDLMGSLVGFGSGSNSTTTQEESQEEETQEQAPIVVEVDSEALKQLKDMGFPEARSKKALLLNRYLYQIENAEKERMNPSLAMEWLFEHDGDADIDEPLGEDELRQVASRRNAPFTPDPAAIAKLKDMGFNEDDIVDALRQTNNNSEAACAYLLGEGGEEPELSLEESNVVHHVLMNPTIQAGLANPRVLQGELMFQRWSNPCKALKALIENPSSAAQYISDPEIGPVLLQVHNIISGQQ